MLYADVTVAVNDVPLQWLNTETSEDGMFFITLVPRDIISQNANTVVALMGNSSTRFDWLRLVP